MAKSRNRKKKASLQPTKRSASIRKDPPSSPKQKMLVGILIFAMILFVGGGLIKSFMNSPKTTTDESGQVMEEPTFRKDSQLSFVRSEAGDADELSKIDIEIVESTKDVSQGLMYRKSMEEDQGMLFKMARNEQQSFWMRNTYIPLDIIFADDDFKIVTIHANTKPLTDKPLPSSSASRYVVEVNAGYCVKKGIKEGDFIKFK